MAGFNLRVIVDGEYVAGARDYHTAHIDAVPSEHLGVALQDRLLCHIQHVDSWRRLPRRLVFLRVPGVTARVGAEVLEGWVKESVAVDRLYDVVNALRVHVDRRVVLPRLHVRNRPVLLHPLHVLGGLLGERPRKRVAVREEPLLERRRRLRRRLGAPGYLSLSPQQGARQLLLRLFRVLDVDPHTALYGLALLPRYGPLEKRPVLGVPEPQIVAFHGVRAAVLVERSEVLVVERVDGATVHPGADLLRDDLALEYLHRALEVPGRREVYGHVGRAVPLVLEEEAR